MTQPIWVVVAGDPAVSGLMDTAATLTGPVVAVVAGDRSVAEEVAAGAADRVIWCGDPGDAVPEAFGPAVAHLATQAAPRLVLSATRGPDRSLLGAVAAALGAEVLTAVTAIAEDAGRLTVTRLAHTGITEVTSRHDGPVAVALPGGRAPAPTPGRPGAPIQEVSLTPAAITLEELTVTGQERRDITGAQRLVAVGRGLRAKEDLPMVERLAGVLRAQLACSRPLAEGLGWFDRDQYVGGSGQHVAPQLYLALGISGQLHHVVGCRGSQVLVAVNSDPQAPIFDEADYGVVADLYQIVPELTRALS